MLLFFFLHFFFQSGAGIKHQLVNCTILVEREEVMVTAELLVADFLQVYVPRKIVDGEDPPWSGQSKNTII